MTRVVALVRAGGAIHCAVALGETVAVSLLSPDSTGALPAAQAAGAVRAVAVWDAAVGATDYLGVAQLLASTARKIGFDVVLCGGGARGVVGPAVAERLGLPHLNRVLDARIEEGKIIARRSSGGLIRTFRAPLPVVLCVESDLPQTLPAREAARGLLPGTHFAGATIERLGLADIAISAAELNWRRRFAPRPTAGPHALPRVFPNVAALAARLAEEGLLPEPESDPD